MSDRTTCAADYDAVAERVLETVFRAGEPATCVDSPPGAGKTALVERATGLAVLALHQRVVCATPKASQAEDLATRVAAAYPSLPVRLLIGATRTPRPDLPQRITVISDPTSIPLGPGVVVSTADKLAFSMGAFGAAAFDLLVLDEAYQVPFKQLLPVIDLGSQMLQVGDPGQLRPLVRIDTRQHEVGRSRPHWSAPREIQRLHPRMPVFTLPASRRLVPDTVTIVQPALYPGLPFGSAASPETRRLHLATAGMRTATDTAVDAVADGASIVCLVLPPRPLNPADEDPELAATMANVVDRFLVRGAEWQGHGPLADAHIHCLDAHRASGGVLGVALRALGRGRVGVSTPEVAQGAEWPITVVKHPLSGIERPGEFDLEPGRFCVMLSRHQIGCVVVARAGVETALDRYRHDCGIAAAGSEDMAWNGYSAHRMVWDALRARARIIGP